MSLLFFTYSWFLIFSASREGEGGVFVLLVSVSLIWSFIRIWFLYFFPRICFGGVYMGRNGVVCNIF